MFDAEDLDAILAERALTPLFQPIVTRPTGELWDHEALIRGPSSSARIAAPDRSVNASGAALQ